MTTLIDQENGRLKAAMLTHHETSKSKCLIGLIHLQPILSFQNVPCSAVASPCACSSTQCLRRNRGAESRGEIIKAREPELSSGTSS